MYVKFISIVTESYLLRLCMDWLRHTCMCILRGLDTLGRFSSISHKGDNFCDYLFAYLHIMPPSEKRCTLKGKYLLPRVASQG